MSYQPNPDRADAPLAAERRRDVRLKQRSLQSNLGPVIDLSRGGLRVRSTRRLRGEQEVVLFNRNGPHLRLRARVVWSRRLGFRKHMAGLQFVDPPDDMARGLARIGTVDFFDL
ncbi:MAG: PilZ domain-containing protein [Acidimicrobiia bacterium]